MNADIVKTLKIDNLTVHIYPSRKTMGRAAAATVTDFVLARVSQQAALSIIFAAAPSQVELLAALATAGLPWRKLVAFHMDEYLGLPADAPQLFGTFLRHHLFDRVNLGEVHYLNSHSPDASAECWRYTRLLREFQPEVVCLGIGENGHIAFNEPDTADFHDPDWVKVVPLDERSRWQQVHDGCFETIDLVPRQAITLTIPALMSAEKLVCVVPGARKADAVYRTLLGSVSSACPASILRTHPNAELFLDADSAALVADILP